MLVSVILSAYNEEVYLPTIFLNLLEQSYPHSKIEIILINAMSDDRTKALMEEFQKNYRHEFYDITVLDNPRRTSNIGFNMGVKASSGDYCLKFDAHSKFPSDFIEKNVSVAIQRNEKVCGGRRPTLIESDSAFAQTLHRVEESVFGSSISNYRKSNKSRYVNSVFHGMYHRDIFRQVGYLDEQLIRTEDNEFHYRIRKNGFKIWYDTSIESFQYMRPTLFKMLHQKFSNGYWIGLTSHVCSQCLSWAHFVPGLFVLALLMCSLLTVVSTIPLLAIVVVYAMLIGSLSIMEMIRHPFHVTMLLIPFLMIAVHVSYGIGTIKGWIQGFSWKKEYFSAKNV